MQMQILKYVHIKIRKGSKEKSSDHSCFDEDFFELVKGTFLVLLYSLFYLETENDCITSNIGFVQCFLPYSKD